MAIDKRVAVNKIHFILSSEFKAYLKHIKVILSTMKKNVFFHLVLMKFTFFDCSKPN